MTTTIARHKPAENIEANLAADAFIEAVERIAALPKGGTITYHEGFIGRERERRPDIARTADAFLRLADAGRVILAQRRLGPGRFAYLAVKAWGA